MGICASKTNTSTVNPSDLSITNFSQDEEIVDGYKLSQSFLNKYELLLSDDGSPDIIGHRTFNLFTDAVTDNNELSFASAHGLAPGTAVVYSDNSVATIAGLTDGATYYVLAGTSAKEMKLAASWPNNGVPLPPAVTIAGGGGAANNKITSFGVIPELTEGATSNDRNLTKDFLCTRNHTEASVTSTVNFETLAVNPHNSTEPKCEPGYNGTFDVSFSEALCFRFTPL